MQNTKKRLTTLVVSMLVLSVIMALTFGLMACDKKEEEPPAALEGEDVVHDPYKGTNGVYSLEYDSSPMKMGAKCFSSIAYIERYNEDYYLTLVQTEKKYLGLNVIENMRIKTTDAEGEEVIISANLVPYEEAYKHIFKVSKELLDSPMTFLAYIPTPKKDISFELVFDMSKTQKISDTITPELQGVLDAQ